MSSVQSGALVGQNLGKYELLALLAVGGTAEIYLARIGGEAGFEKYLVVKCLLDHLADEPEYVKMFLDEARLGAQLDHSNIVQTLELGEQDGRYYMAMEYLAGMSLAQLARRTQERVPGGYMPVDLVLGLAAQTCAGLNYAHRKAHAGGQALNLVHRDISPQNLVVSFEGVLKIVDFGIAKADMRDTHTRSGTIKGKFAYMSPEQCLAKQVDHRTDIFALGVIVHELLCARRLFKRQTTYETYEAIIKGKVPKPSQVNPRLDPALDDVVLKALAYNREDRYESAEAFGQTLLETLHRRGTSISASDVAAYYEKYFEPELSEHARRMRELITGKRRRASDDSMNWDAAEVIEELDAAALPAASDAVPDDGATRIEMNPLEKAQQAHDAGGARPAEPEALPEHDTQDLSGEIDALTIDRPVSSEAARARAPSRTTSDLGPKPKKTILGTAPPSVKAALAEARRRDSSAPPPIPPSPPAPPRSSAEAKTLFDPNGGAAPQGPSELPQRPGFGPPPPGSGQIPVPPDTLPPIGPNDSSPRALPPPPMAPQPPMPPRSAYAYPSSGQTAIEPVRPPWLIAAVFAVSLGVGLGITLLVAQLF